MSMKLDAARSRARLDAHHHGVLCTLHPERGPDPQPVVYAVSRDGQVGVPVDRVKPKASTRLKRETNLAKWRASLREDLAGPATGAPRPTADEGRRSKMMNERRQTEAWKTMQERQAHARDAAFDTMMRRGDMQDLHREAMRRMQGEANRNAG